MSFDLYEWGVQIFREEKLRPGDEDVDSVLRTSNTWKYD